MATVGRDSICSRGRDSICKKNNGQKSLIIRLDLHTIQNFVPFENESLEVVVPELEMLDLAAIRELSVFVGNFEILIDQEDHLAPCDVSLTFETFRTSPCVDPLA